MSNVLAVYELTKVEKHDLVCIHWVEEEDEIRRGGTTTGY